jgi:hypothetical protein
MKKYLIINTADLIVNSCDIISLEIKRLAVNHKTAIIRLCNNKLYSEKRFFGDDPDYEKDDVVLDIFDNYGQWVDCGNKFIKTIIKYFKLYGELK